MKRYYPTWIVCRTDVIFNTCISGEILKNGTDIFEKMIRFILYFAVIVRKFKYSENLDFLKMRKSIAIGENAYWKLAELKVKFRVNSWDELIDRLYEVIVND